MEWWQTPIKESELLCVCVCVCYKFCLVLIESEFFFYTAPSIYSPVMSASVVHGPYHLSNFSISSHSMQICTVNRADKQKVYIKHITISKRVYLLCVTQQPNKCTRKHAHSSPRLQLPTLNAVNARVQVEPRVLKIRSTRVGLKYYNTVCSACAIRKQDINSVNILLGLLGQRLRADTMGLAGGSFLMVTLRVYLSALQR